MTDGVSVGDGDSSGVSSGGGGVTVGQLVVVSVGVGV